MSSSNRTRLTSVAVFAAATALAARAAAQQPAPGFSIERLYPSPPGAGWVVMDDLDMHGRLGGAMSLTAGYAHDPLHVGEGAERLDVVSDQAFADFGLAITHDRWRFSIEFQAPIAIVGHSGVVDGYAFAPAAHVTTGSNPDTLADPRVGLDVRLAGQPGGPLRVGAGAQLFAPNGDRAERASDGTFVRANYTTDGTFRAMLRALAAGDLGHFAYAGQLGVHVRPLDPAPQPGSPRGSELLFGLAGGTRFSPSASGRWTVVTGPEVFGATAFRGFAKSDTTALEALLTARLEGTAARGRQLRFKLGAGVGLEPSFGAPAWRILLAVEMFNRELVPQFGAPH